jgi:hypothetical protein
MECYSKDGNEVGMKKKKITNPPGIPYEFFRWFCHPDLREEIEGDLLERFHNYQQQHGEAKARIFFLKEVILLFRPAVIGNIRHLTINPFSAMKKRHWLQLTALNVIAIVCMLLPFLPGPYDNLSMALSEIMQSNGFFGLLLVPIGLIWLIQELKRRVDSDQSPNNWTNGYYLAVTATVLGTLIMLFFSFGMFMLVGMTGAILSLLFTCWGLYKIIPMIKGLRHDTKHFHAAPLYLLTLPLIAFAFRMFLVGPVSDYSRNFAIQNGEQLIAEIENYYQTHQEYPENIEELYNVPKPFIMGIEKFQYERRGSDYNLWFIQWQSIIATKEVVMYNKSGNYNVKGHYASFDASKQNWRYYWLD